MSEPPDPHALARRFVTLWQEQMLAVAADPAMAEATARWLTLFAPMLAGAAPARPWQPRDDGAAAATAPATATAATPTTPGPAATAGASRPGGDDLDQLARRLAALEERLAAIESAVRRADRRPRRAAPRRRP